MLRSGLFAKFNPNEGNMPYEPYDLGSLRDDRLNQTKILLFGGKNDAVVREPDLKRLVREIQTDD